jgi:alanyl-tRNA synthetase
MNVIADHIRALTFAIADGALPSNESRGYVLRRILRRAARYGRNLNMHKPFIYELVGVLVNTMRSVFPEITEKKSFIEEVVKSEEESFNETLDRGLVFFNEEIEKMKISGSKLFSGDVAFKLHDTYGFPVDLTQLMARELSYNVDVDKFEVLMNEQKAKAREARKDLEITFEFAKDEKYTLNVETKYVPYTISEKGTNTRILGTEVHESVNKTIVYLYENPFYHESGGQVSDKGKLILNDGREYIVTDSLINGVVVNGIERHFGDLNVIAKVDYPRRLSIQRNHSATHLVHEALRQVLGSHVKQMGSYLDDKLLRFDFPHFHKVTVEQIKEIEDIVNYKISENIPVHWEIMAYDKANKIPNVKKYFGEKYGDEVRVVYIDEKFSVELCGGTHVKDTSDIGLFKIVKEESISSGVRRIFARTGEGIVTYLNEKTLEIERLISDLPEKYSKNFKSGIENFKTDVKSVDFRDSVTLKKLLQYHDSTITSLYELRERYLEERKQTEKQLAKQKVKTIIELLHNEINNATVVDGIKIVTLKCDVDNIDELKEAGDTLRVKLGSGVGLLYSVTEGKINLVTVVTDDLIKSKNLNAGKIVGETAKLLGGGGGGKPHMATAGGKNISKLDEAVKNFPGIVKKYIKIH